MSRAKQIVRSDYDDEGTNFKFSNNWFLGFRKRHRRSFRKKNSCFSNLLRNYENLSRTFTKSHKSVRNNGTYINDGKTYDKTGTDVVWFARGSSGLDKRQCTVQLTIFADVKTLMPLIIFRGKSMRINVAEKRA